MPAQLLVRGDHLLLKTGVLLFFFAKFSSMVYLSLRRTKNSFSRGRFLTFLEVNMKNFPKTII